MISYSRELYKHAQGPALDIGRLVIVLYEEAMKLLRDAIKAQEMVDIPTKTTCINRILNIIAELNQSLNMQKGGEIAANLRQIYSFWNEHLLLSKEDHDGHNLKDVKGMMSSLAQAWEVFYNSSQAVAITQQDTLKNSLHPVL
jgi:flagellar protein FliS